MHSIDGVFASLAFVLGVLMARTTLCGVANIQPWVDTRKVDGLLRLLVVACASGLVLLALVQLAPGMVRLPMDTPVMLSVMAGGVLLGVGALVNGGCFLGTVLYIGRGNANLLASALLMGQGARLIPGGHDLLLLWTIPGLAWHGLAMPQAPTGSVIPSIRPIASAGVSIMPGTNALPSVAPLPSTSPVA